MSPNALYCWQLRYREVSEFGRNRDTRQIRQNSILAKFMENPMIWSWNILIGWIQIFSPLWYHLLYISLALSWVKGKCTRIYCITVSNVKFSEIYRRWMLTLLFIYCRVSVNLTPSVTRERKLRLNWHRIIINKQ